MTVTVQMLVRITDPAMKAKSDAEIIEAVKRSIPGNAHWEVLWLTSTEDFIVRVEPNERIRT